MMASFSINKLSFCAIFLLFAVTSTVNCKKITNSNDDVDDERVFLTPLIEKGEVEKARELSKVDPTLFAGVESHSAYITVNKTNKWHTFFWYFPVENKSLNSTPWVIWLQGGPGASSMYGLFTEIGPLQCITNTTASKMPVTWASDYSLLFIDNPIGAGFSYSEDENKFVSTDEESGICLLAFIEQFLKLFPELQTAPLFIAGESYAGKYVPSFGHQIHQNKNKSVTIPLKGLIIGGGWTDPPSLLHYSELGAQLGFWDFDKANEWAAIENKARTFYEEGKIQDYITEEQKLEKIYSSVPNVYNMIKDLDLYAPSDDFLNIKQVQSAIHVGYIPYKTFNPDVYKHFVMSNSFYISAKPWLEELLEHYGVLAYNGQLDFIVGYALSEHTYRSLKWSGAEVYLKADRKNIRSDNPDKTLNPIGYVKGAGNFMEVMIRAAGHMSPADQPLASKQVIDMFINKFK